MEVDFIVYGVNEFAAIEVKNSVHADRSDASPLEAFISDYPEARGFLLYRGERRVQLTPHVTAISAEQFLKELTPERPRITDK